MRCSIYNALFWKPEDVRLSCLVHLSSTLSSVYERIMSDPQEQMSHVNIQSPLHGGSSLASQAIHVINSPA